MSNQTTMPKSPNIDRHAIASTTNPTPTTAPIIALILAFAVLCGASSAFAQGTPIPYVISQYFDSNGNPLASGGLCTYEAGTTTLVNVYTTAALNVAHPNPVRFNAAGRPSVSGATVGIFLTPGVSYKFVLKDATVTTCSPDTGVTLWSVDNVQAVPGSASAVDVATATAGENIAAGDAVFLSNGACSLLAGQWYRTDSDFTCKSTTTAMVGIAPNAIASGAQGAVRLAGAVTLAGPLSVGASYFAGATPGAVVATVATNALRIGVAQTATVLIVGYTKAPVMPLSLPCGRLTLTTGVPVTTADVTAATTIYYTPTGCNAIFLHDGTVWSPVAFAQVSIAVPATTATGYDVFAYDNAGVVALELTAWSSLTARATAITLQDGVYIKSGPPSGRLYLGSFRTTGVSGQTEDSLTKRYVWNMYNRVPRQLRVVDVNGSWAYTTATVRQARGSTANQVETFIGIADVLLDLTLNVTALNDASNPISVGIGTGSTTTYTEGAWQADITGVLTCRLMAYPAIGYQFWSWNEWSTAAGTTTFYGSTTTGSLTVSGLRGWILG